MTSKELLTYFYTRTAFHKFSQNIDTAMIKKKNRKGNSLNDELPIAYSIYDFFQMEPIKKSKYFFTKQLIYSLQGKSPGRKTQTKDNKIQEFISDISQFRVLHKKIVGKFLPKGVDNKIKGIDLKLKMIYQHCSNLFSNLVEMGGFDQQIQKVQKQICEIKKQLIVKNCILYEKIQLRMIEYKSQIQIFSQKYQLDDSFRQYQYPKFNISDRKEEIQQKANQMISNFIGNHLMRVLEVTKLKQLFIQSKMYKKWDGSQLLQQEANIINKKVSNKALYAAEQNIKTLRLSIKRQNIYHEYYIRQKNYTQIFNGQEAKVKPIQYEKSLKASNVERKAYNIQQKGKNVRLSNELETRPQKLIDLMKPKSKSQLIDIKSGVKQGVNMKYNSQSNVQRYYVSNLSQITVPKHRRNQAISTGVCSSNAYIQKKQKKPPSPINVLNIQQYSDNKQVQPSFPRGKIQKSNIQLSAISKKIKYPIKIEHLQIYSSDRAMICYNIQDFSLKNLALKFIKDRLKYRQNKIKIQYPYEYSVEHQLKVSKSLQILNCIGAEVYCQPECSYQYWNKIDEVLILAVSWMLELPVKQVVQRYGQYFCANLTKK